MGDQKQKKKARHHRFAETEEKSAPYAGTRNRHDEASQTDTSETSCPSEPFNAIRNIIFERAITSNQKHLSIAINNQQPSRI
jgi:hypothetical protein